MPPPGSYCPAGAETYQTRLFNVLQPLPGDFRSHDVTSESLPVT